MKIIDLEQGSKEWLKWRLTRHTATDSPVCLGVSPYKTKRDLFFEKMGLGEAVDTSKEYIFAQGHKAEAFLRDYIRETLGYDFAPICAESSEIPYMAASLDGHIPGVGVAEMKLMGTSAIKSIIAKGAGEIPEHYMIQVQHQMYVAQEEKAFFSCFDNKKTGHVIEVARDESIIKRILVEAERFRELVEKNQAPPLSEQDTFYITDQEQREKFRALRDLKERMDALKAQYEALEKEVKENPPHCKVFCEGVNLTKVTRRGSIDYSKIPEIKKLDKDYLEKFRKADSESFRLTIKKGA